MTQLTINIEDRKILPHLKKILNAIDGVSIAHAPKKQKSGLDIALDEVAKGNLNHYDTVDDLFKAIGI